jgi:hypothetical protein
MSGSTCASRLFELTWNMTKLKRTRINISGYDVFATKQLYFINNSTIFFNGYIFTYKGQQQQTETMYPFLLWIGFLLYTIGSNLQRLKFHNV